MIGRALLIVIAGLTFNSASAQTDSIPWRPVGPGFGVPSPAPSAPCAALKEILSDLQGRGQAIGAANERKASVQVACQLFREYMAAAAKAAKALETDGPSCGAPTQVGRQVRENEAAAQRIGEDICALAKRGGRSLYGPGREFDGPSWRYYPTPTFDRPKPFEMSPRRGL
jgi:hypothetical protein